MAWDGRQGSQYAGEPERDKSINNAVKEDLQELSAEAEDVTRSPRTAASEDVDVFQRMAVTLSC